MTASTASIPLVSRGDLLHPRSRTATIVILGLLVALGPFTTDLYLPAFPAVQAAFQTSDVALQLTLSATVLGFATGQLLVGPLSDRFGRRVPLLIAASLHVVACLLASAAPNIETLTVLRLLQGFGAAGGGVVASATVRDLFHGHRLVRMLANMGLVIGAAPILAPLIGSQLMRLMDWRGLFVCLAVYGAAAVLLAVAFIGETRPKADRAASTHSTVGSRYRAVLGDRVFIGAAIAGSMQFCGIFAYLSVSPFLLQESYRLTPQVYGLAFAANSIGMMIGAQTASRLMRRVGPQWILVGTVTVQLLAGAALLTMRDTSVPLPVLLAPLFAFMTASGFAFPSVQVLGLLHHGEEAGTAASLLGAGNFALSALVAPLVGIIGSHAASSVGLIATVCGAIAMLAVWTLVRPRSVPPIR